MELAEIGERNIDVNHDWLQGYSSYKDYPIKYYKNFLNMTTEDNQSEDVPFKDKFALTGDQQRILYYVHKHISGGGIRERFLLNILGHAGNQNIFYNTKLYRK